MLRVNENGFSSVAVGLILLRLEVEVPAVDPVVNFKSCNGFPYRSLACKTFL
jgi:hypothetical protein